MLFRHKSLVVTLLLILNLFLHSCAHPNRPGGIAFSYNGLERKYLLYSPLLKPTHTGRRPLLLVLHGGGGTNRGMVWLTQERFNELADRDGFFVVYPQGIDKSWNDGRPDKIRAIAPVTAQIPAAIESLCRSESAVSLAVFNGTEDPLVPYNGGANFCIMVEKR